MKCVRMAARPKAAAGSSLRSLPGGGERSARLRGDSLPTRGTRGLYAAPPASLWGTAALLISARLATLGHAIRVVAWLREIASELVPEMNKESVPSFVIAGQHKSIARKRTTLALRGCFFAQWRAQRSAAIHGRRPRSRGKIRDALNKRLRAAILRDWVRCHGQHGFERRWRSYVAITDGTVSIVNLPTIRKADKPDEPCMRALSAG